MVMQITKPERSPGQTIVRQFYPIRRMAVEQQVTNQPPKYLTMAEKDSAEVGAYLRGAVVPGDF